MFTFFQSPRGDFGFLKSLCIPRRQAVVPLLFNPLAGILVF